jgi:hypothetical protein
MPKIKGICRVTLEPELEEEAGLWTIAQTRATIKKWRRWLRQLEVKLVIMELDLRRSYSGRAKSSLKVVPRRLLPRN